MTLKVLELFGGIGAPRSALERLGVDFEIVDYVEIDKFAVNSYNAIYDTNYEPQDISEWDKDVEVDMLVHGSPCQDFSLAGQQAGGKYESGTRSSLMWETVRIVDTLKPRYVIWENVKNVLSKKHKPTFDNYIKEMSRLGYVSYYKVLNAKHYGIPQNRERVFTISILGDHFMYPFPQEKELSLRLKDLLEDGVDEKYFLSQKLQDRLVFKPNFKNDIKTLGTTDPNATIGQRSIVYAPEGIMGALTATDYKQPKQIGIIQVGQYDTPTRNNSNRFRTYDPRGVSPCLSTMGGGGLEPHIPVVNATKKGYLEAGDGDGVDLAYPNSKLRRGRVQVGMSQTITTDDSKAVVVKTMKEQYCNYLIENDKVVEHDVIDHSYTKNRMSRDEVKIMGKNMMPTMTTRPDNMGVVVKDKRNVIVDAIYNNREPRIYDEYAPTLRAGRHGLDVVSDDGVIESNLRIRKLTPKECWRLMGFDDIQFDKAQQVNSNAQLYKQAGNSIVVNVLVELIKPLCDDWFVNEFLK